MTVFALAMTAVICVASVAGAGPANAAMELGRASLTTSLGHAGADAHGLWPGAESAVLMQVANDGDTRWGSLTLEVATSGRSPLVTNPVDGLQVRVDACSTRWDGAGGGERPTCDGRIDVLVPTQPVLDGSYALTGLSSALPGGSDTLRVTIALPRHAGNEMQGLSTDLDYVVRADQLA